MDISRLTPVTGLGLKVVTYRIYKLDKIYMLILKNLVNPV